MSVSQGPELVVDFLEVVVCCSLAVGHPYSLVVLDYPAWFVLDLLIFDFVVLQGPSACIGITVLDLESKSREY
jgi:hypothetical protein